MSDTERAGRGGMIAVGVAVAGLALVVVASMLHDSGDPKQVSTVTTAGPAGLESTGGTSSSTVSSTGPAGSGGTVATTVATPGQHSAAPVAASSVSSTTARAGSSASIPAAAAGTTPTTAPAPLVSQQGPTTTQPAAASTTSTTPPSTTTTVATPQGPAVQVQAFPASVVQAASYGIDQPKVANDMAAQGLTAPAPLLSFSGGSPTAGFDTAKAQQMFNQYAADSGGPASVTLHAFGVAGGAQATELVRQQLAAFRNVKVTVQ